MAHPIFSPIMGDWDRWGRELEGRLAGRGVSVDTVLEAISDFELNGPLGAGPEALLDALMGFVTTRRRGRRVPVVLDELGRWAKERWAVLWREAHNGQAYAEPPGSDKVFRDIAARARARAREVRDLKGEVTLRQCAEHYLRGYLALDDAQLVKAKYPITLLLHRITSIGEYEPPRKPRVTQEPAAEQGLVPASAVVAQLSDLTKAIGAPPPGARSRNADAEKGSS